MYNGIVSKSHEIVIILKDYTIKFNQYHTLFVRL